MGDSRDLEAVRVPEELRPLFRKAEEYVREYFAGHRSDPSRGTVEFHGERYIHVRAASISIEFFDLVRSVYRGHRDADEVARGLLYDVAHAIGLADAADFRSDMGVTEPIEALSAGPIHFAYTGWAFVDIHPDSHPSPDDEFLLVYEHPNSFEADAWLSDARQPTGPVCVMNAGYSSGWCEAAYGFPLYAREIGCRALGHDSCRFVMAPPHRLDQRIAEYLEAHPEIPRPIPRGVPRFFEQLRRRDEELVHAQRMEAIGRLAGGIAHDFNNLLTVILTCAEQLELTLADGSSDHRNAEAIVAAAERAGSLTRQLLALSHEQVLDLQTVDLGELVRALEPLLSGLLSGDVRLVMGDLPPARVDVDVRSLEQVIVNLAVNALEAMPDGGTVTVAIEPAEDAWMLVVRDEGIGMPPEVQERVFEPFFTTKEGNSGLGLATARGIVSQVGGSIRMDSTPGRGTRVEVVLPRSLHDTSESTECSEDSLPPGASRVVLVIEDDGPIRTMLGRYLPDRGYEVHLARSAEEARTLAGSLERIDLVLSDVVMPGESGPSAVESLRERHPEIRVLFMTGYAERSIQWLPDDAAVIRKPFTLEALHRRLLALEVS